MRNAQCLSLPGRAVQGCRVMRFHPLKSFSCRESVNRCPASLAYLCFPLFFSRPLFHPLGCFTPLFNAFIKCSFKVLSPDTVWFHLAFWYDFDFSFLDTDILNYCEFFNYFWFHASVGLAKPESKGSSLLGMSSDFLQWWSLPAGPGQAEENSGPQHAWGALTAFPGRSREEMLGVWGSCGILVRTWLWTSKHTSVCGGASLTETGSSVGLAWGHLLCPDLTECKHSRWL